MRDSVGQYLHEIGAMPLLDAAKERELSQLVERGREAQNRLDAGERGVALKRAVRAGAVAKDHFIRANLRLVVSIARRYPLPVGMDLLDLVQEGNLGLEHAVDKFDWRKGFKFSTYATFWIRQSIGRALDQKANLIRLPSERSSQLRAALRQVSGEGDDLDAELAHLHRLSTPTSLDRKVGEDGDQELVDLLPGLMPGPEAIVLDALELEMVDGLLGRLEPRARLAVKHRFGMRDGEKHSFREVGEVLGVSAEAARRIVKRAVDELKLDAETLNAA
jgi:RNA polymerase primary sigma factor